MKTSFITSWQGFAILLMMGLCEVTRAQVNSGSNGSDGTFNPATNLVINMADHPNGIYQYSSVNISNGVTVTFIPNANNTPVTWLVQGNVIINGTVNVSGQTPNSANGGAGGPGGWAGGAGGSGVNLQNPGQGPGGGPTGYSGVYATPIAGDSAAVYGNGFILPLLGGSGGSGNGCSGGGGGGGAILIAANQSILLTGAVNASGGSGLDVSSCSASANGSGGAVRLVTESFSGSGSIYAGGGSYYYNGQSSSGRIRIDAFQDIFAGQISADPSAVSQGYQPIIIPVGGQGVQLNIASVGGMAVSPSPSGQLVTPDAVLSGQQANPLPVVVNCSNLPLNTAIAVTVKPANGSSVSALGYNTTGTLAASTATISIVIPRGGGIIYATAATGN